jgi:thioesterase domain-containing protein
LYRDALLAGRSEEGLGMLQAAAALRPVFRSVSELPQLPKPVRLADGPGAPSLFCIPSPVGMGSPMQYARFARHFQGHRSVSVLPVPGFLENESLPASADVVAQLLADVVHAGPAADSAPAVLVGLSAGGLLAVATAQLLEESGQPPAAVVLLDTYGQLGSTIDDLFPKILGEILARDEPFGQFTATTLTGMAAYLKLIKEIGLTGLKAPILFVRPAKLFTVGAQDPDERAQTDDWRASWDTAHTVLEVPGDHFTMTEEHAESTAQAVEKWLSTYQ